VKPSLPFRKALADPGLLGHTLKGPSWAPWRTLLVAAMGEPLDEVERAVFTTLTGREQEPLQRVEEFVGVIGRRGGKSRAISVLATYIAGLCTHPNLVSGERGVLLVIAPDQRQADIVLDYTEANFRASPILRQLIESRTARALKLTNHIDVEVRSSDFRRLRGPTYICVIADECAFWLSEYSSNPDTEILNSVRPGLATTAGPLFIISSPYARRGELWRLYSRHYGPAGDPLILVAQATSRTMNPALAQSVVDRAMERDAASASAEYGAQFRSDLEAFVTIEAVRACVMAGIYERAPAPSITYSAFVDPSGGSADSFTLAVGHADVGKEVIVIDALREIVPPFSPEVAVGELAALLKSYRITNISGDRYGGEWPVEQFGKFSITYEPSPKPKSGLYTDLLPLINSARIELLDHTKLISQLTALERRTARGGRDIIDHPPNGHDDIANAVAGLAAINVTYGGYDFSYRGFTDDPADDPVIARTERAKRAFMQEWGRYMAPERFTMINPRR
jgi:hypothetical protein